MLAVSLAFTGRYLIEHLSSRYRTVLSRREAQGRLLVSYLAYLGPIYIKMGQILATRTDLIPKEWAAALRQLQDAAPRMRENQALKIIQREIRDVLVEVVEIEPTPIASASIAQVHRGRIIGGEVVAIKIIKNGVRRRVYSGTAVLGALARIAHALLPTIRRYDVPSRFAEISRLLRQQTNLLQEALQQQAIRENFRGHPFVRVPRVHGHLCTERILVMEFIDAIPGTQLERVPFPRARLARRFQDAIYTMLYMHGIAHGDPHPGNVMFTPTGEVILLDFGITVELTEDEKWGLSSFYYAAIRKEWQVAASRFTEHFVAHLRKLGNAEEIEYYRAIEEILVYHFETNSNQWSTIKYFRSIEAVLRNYGLRYTTAFTKVELVFLSCEGFATQIDPSIDIWENARAFVDRYSPYISKEVRHRFDRHFSREIPASLALRARANQYLVAPTHIDRYFFPSAYPLFVKEARGGVIVDVDGNAYVDLSGGYGPHFLGYRHPAINSAIQASLESGFFNAIGNEPELELSQIIVEAFGSRGKAILCNSGTEAVLLAMRLCRAYRRRNVIAKFEGHYHGFSDQGMVSSWFRFKGGRLNPSPVAGSQGVDPNVVSNTLILQYGRLESFQLLIERAESIACVICEPMSSSTAKADGGFLKALRAICDEYGIPLVFDEVVTGFRVAYGGAQTLLDVEPDITCLGKVIGGGLPCGCVLGRPELIDLAKSADDPFVDYEKKVFAGGTMSGNSLTCTAGVAALHYLRDNPRIYDEVNAKSVWLAERLASHAAEAEVPCQISASRSIFSLSFSYRESALYRDKLAGSNFKATIALAYYMRKHGVYLPELHSFLLSAAHTYDELQRVSDSFAESLREMIADGIFTI